MVPHYLVAHNDLLVYNYPHMRPQSCMANRRHHTSTNNPNPPVPSAGSDGIASGRHPSYHGIRCRGGKWVSEIREPNKSSRIWLGTYPTPEMAAAAYDVAALALKGSYAVLNFPDSVLPNTLPDSPTADDIRAVAADAAAARHPGHETGSGSSTAIGPGSGSGGEFVDQDEAFGMPNMLRDMAEGMLLSPPRIGSNPPEGHGDGSGGWSLWDN